MQKAGSRLRVVTALAATVLLGTGALTGCSSGDSDQDGSSSTTPAKQEAGGGMGEPVSSSGATVTVNAAFETSQIQRYSNGSWRADQPRPTESEEAADDAKFIVIQTTVVNDTEMDMDLTCSSTKSNVIASLQTDPMASYRPVRDLFDIPGNPACNSYLGAGLSTEMTWIYQVPKDRTATFLKFRTLLTEDDITGVQLDKFGQKSPATGKQPSPTTGTPAGDSGDTGTSSDAITGDAGGDPNPTADPGTGPASAPDSAASDNVSPAANPVIGFTGAPSVDSPHVLDKEIAGCGDPALHQTGTTFFTDGTSGWTESCAAQMG